MINLLNLYHYCLVSNKFSKAFTLLEVLIALAILSISLLGVYSLINQSLNMEFIRDEKEYLFSYGYERMLQQINFPDSKLKEAERVKGKSISYDTKIVKDDKKKEDKFFEIMETKITSGGDNVFYYQFIPLE